jgi:hypothetical protein
MLCLLPEVAVVSCKTYGLLPQTVATTSIVTNMTQKMTPLGQFMSLKSEK